MSICILCPNYSPTCTKRLFFFSSVPIVFMLEWPLCCLSNLQKGAAATVIQMFSSFRSFISASEISPRLRSIPSISPSYSFYISLQCSRSISPLFLSSISILCSPLIRLLCSHQLAIKILFLLSILMINST